jgi:Cof subfamily protein (haloacid dehalogenase superfamily)
MIDWIYRKDQVFLYKKDKFPPVFPGYLYIYAIFRQSPGLPISGILWYSIPMKPPREEGSMRPDRNAVKALALDLDGTALGTDNNFSERTLRALKGCMERGIQIIICTGRAVEAAERFRAAIGACGPMVYFNGAVVADMPSRKVLHATLLGLEVVDFCVDIARSMDAHYQVFFPAAGEGENETLLIEKPRPEAEMYRNHTGIRPVIGDIKKAIAAPGAAGCIKSMFIAGAEVQDKIRPLLEERFGGSIYVARTFPTFLEIMAAEVSKGAGLRAAMEQRGLRGDEVIALGDEENDIPMFAAAGFSAAPANAKEAVKAAADIVIGSNAADGPAAFLEELFGLFRHDGQ